MVVSHDMMLLIGHKTILFSKKLTCCDPSILTLLVKVWFSWGKALTPLASYEPSLESHVIHEESESTIFSSYYIITNSMSSDGIIETMIGYQIKG
jgi:hypothetical protein